MTSTAMSKLRYDTCALPQAGHRQEGFFQSSVMDGDRGCDSSSQGNCISILLSFKLLGRSIAITMIPYLSCFSIFGNSITSAFSSEIPFALEIILSATVAIARPIGSMPIVERNPDAYLGLKGHDPEDAGY